MSFRDYQTRFGLEILQLKNVQGTFHIDNLDTLKNGPQFHSQKVNL
jgi:hypothetical protein